MLKMMHILKSPSKTVLDCPGFDEAILVLMYDGDYNSLQPVGHQLGK